MTPDEQHAMYMRAIKEAQAHMKPSPETLERFSKLEIEMVKISGCIEQIAQSTKRIEKYQAIQNSKVAKHQEWISLNNNAVTKDFPGIKEQVSENTKKIYAGVITLIIIQALVGIGIVTFK